MAKRQKVRLYLPNTWRKYIGDLAPESDKHFNWFLCSQRYKDPASGWYVADIAKGAMFYDESTGQTLVIQKDIHAKLLIVDDPENIAFGATQEKISSMIHRYSYQGIARMQKCNLKNKDRLFMCMEASFEFVDGVLKVYDREE